MDVTPKKCTRKSSSLYKHSFNNKKYTHTNIQEVHNKHNNPIIEKNTLVQILEKIFEQMSLKAGIKKFGDNIVKGIKKSFSNSIFVTVLILNVKRI